MTKEYLESILTEYGVAFTDSLADRLLKEFKPCDDAISRQAVLELVADYDLSMGQLVKSIHALPPVTPQPKIGYWKVVSDGYGDNAYICECSKCKDTVWVYKDADRKWNYCPNCGAKMQEVEE